MDNDPQAMAPSGQEGVRRHRFAPLLGAWHSLALRGASNRLAPLWRALKHLLLIGLLVVVYNPLSDRGLLSWAWWLLLAGAFLFLVRDAMRPEWWHYVKTGSRPGLFTALLRGGDLRVRLEESGANEIQVIKAIREITGMGLVEAKSVVDSAPSVVAAGLSREGAHTAQRMLQAAGATTSVEASRLGSTDTTSA